MPSVYRCPGFFSGSAEVGRPPHTHSRTAFSTQERPCQVSSSGWVVLFILIVLLSILGYITFKNRGSSLTLQDVLDLIPRELPSLSWPPWGPSRGRCVGPFDQGLHATRALPPTCARAASGTAECPTPRSTTSWTLETKRRRRSCTMAICTRTTTPTE